MCISRIFEEVFPFFSYCRNRSRLEKRRACLNILDLKMFADYEKLSPEQLTRRLDDEHQRASAIDEKTFKMTLSLSVGLTIIGLTTAFLTKPEFDGAILIVLHLPVVLGLFYLLVAVYMALGALRTLPKYGYGTEFVLMKLQENTRKAKILADALARQECINTIRLLRNETAYQALRNGFYLLSTWILIFVVTSGGTMSEGLNIGPSSPDSATLRTNEIPHCLQEHEDRPVG